MTAGRSMSVGSITQSLFNALDGLGSPLMLATIIEGTPNGVLVADRRHMIHYANPSALRMTGFDIDDLQDRSIPDLLGLTEAEVAVECRSLAGPPEALEKRPRHELIIVNRTSGERYYVEASFLRPHPEHDRYAVLLVDINERKQLEIELRRRNSFFHKLIDSSVDGIIASDMKGRLILFNQGAQQLLGYTEEEARRDVHVTKLYPEGEAESIIRRMRSDQYGGRGKLLRHELVAITNTGTAIPMSFSGGIIYDDGQEIATFGIFTDLRRIQKAEEDLQQTHQMLQQSEKMAGLGRLAAGVAHEINNPMSGIMLYANLAREELGDEHASAADLDVIIREAERCKTIVSDLLEFSHEHAYDMGCVDLNDIITKTLALLEMQPLFHNIRLELDLDPELMSIQGNAAKLSQVVMNLLINAAQAMDGRGVLRVASRTRAHGGMVELSIADSGPGIDAVNLPRIFDPFFTTKAQGKGTGLGLSVSYAIVKEHKGTIRARSEEGKGATFMLRFPIMETGCGGRRETETIGREETS